MRKKYKILLFDWLVYVATAVILLLAVKEIYHVIVNHIL